jgi:hypothetical protein
MINALRVEQRSTTLDTVHLIALFEQEFGEI